MIAGERKNPVHDNTEIIKCTAEYIRECEKQMKKVYSHIK